MLIRRLFLFFTLICTAHLSHAGQAPESCIAEASQYHSVHPGVLKAILKVESNFKNTAVNKNNNGTIDVGIGQINSMHFRELAGYGITPNHLMDACVGTYVSAWMLSRQIKKYGNTWQGIATYHSATPVHNNRYARLIYNQLVRDGWIRGALIQAAPTSRTTSTQVASRSATQSAKAPRNQGALVIDVEEGL